jgi:hypothetical protein
MKPARRFPQKGYSFWIEQPDALPGRFHVRFFGLLTSKWKGSSHDVRPKSHKSESGPRSLLRDSRMDGDLQAMYKK